MLIVLSIDHRHSTVADRAPFALTEARRARLYRAIRRLCGGQLVILTTCNRIELVTWVPAARRTEGLAMVRRVARRLAPDLGERFLDRATVLVGPAAALHLARVAAGLESQVPGDSQILGQVRAAYALAVTNCVAGPELHRLFQMVLRAGKRVRAETEFGRRRATVGGVAARHALDWHRDKQPISRDGTAEPPRVVLVGAGSAAATAARDLVAAGALVTVLNRTGGRAELLAHSIGSEAAAFEARHDIVAMADAAVVATGALEPVICRDLLEEARARLGRSNAALLLLDLAVPRNVEVEVAGLPGVVVRGLDDLAEDSTATAVGPAHAATAIVAREAATFQDWLAVRAIRLADVA